MIYKVCLSNMDSLEELVDFGALKSLSSFASITSGFNQHNSNLAEQLLAFPPFVPSKGVEYPYVGVVDSGIREDHPYLKYWVEQREDFVLSSEKNCSHGSFVGGVVSYGDRVRGVTTQYDGVKLIDVVAIPNTDPKYGNTGSLSEDELVEILNEVVPKYSGKVKVWNLSLGSSKICEDQAFSDLAMALDEIQDENDVMFVISAGNYEDRPLRAWPPEDETKFNDRITSPADSIRAITVGSISHTDTELSKMYEPSPFSRRGPGPNFIVKPDLVDFGGTLSLTPPAIKGVSSFGEWGDLVEGVGTSYSTPRISSLLSKIHHFMAHNPSRNLSKALLIHSALDLRNNKRPVRDEMKYLGFGKPMELDEILNCSQSSSTFVLEGTLFPSSHVEITDFPFPNVLVEEDKCFGEIFMTLVYNPPLSGKFGFEYCRSNIEVSLGTDKPNGYSGEVPLERMGELEKELVENGFKWSPVKVYHRKIEKGIADHPWKLKLTLQGRSNEILEPQDFSLVITIRDPKGEKHVYNDVSQQLDQRFLYQDLQISSRIRPVI
jgi:serine protease AprX